ncbi:putative second beta subunit of nicotinic acetylcholine receptor [Escherichia coli 2871950]|nr:putative second beta subunit of nicotinic acetylcholine receptor [Escherichia coli 2871950]
MSWKLNHCWGVKSHIQTHLLPQIARLNGLPERAQVWFM